MKSSPPLKVFVDPCCNVLYASFYLEGIRKLYGRKAIKFTSKYFDNFKHNGRVVPMVISKDGELRKIVIDFGDADHIDVFGIEWCDLYAKVNINPGKESAHPHKMCSIGPSFGIRVFSLFETLSLAALNLVKGHKRIHNKKQFLGEYRSQFKRPNLDDYRNPFESDDRKVFFASSLWKIEDETNQFRANFINACKSLANIDFTGGFSPRTKNDVRGFEDLTMQARVDMDDYLELTKKSLTTFSTPAVAKCHGWKIGEFLLMGKAIISTPLLRELPSPLLDGKHLLFTDGSEEDMRQKIELLRSNGDLRRSIERNALAYFNDLLLPEKVVAQVFEKAFA